MWPIVQTSCCPYQKPQDTLEVVHGMSPSSNCLSGWPVTLRLAQIEASYGGGGEAPILENEECHNSPDGGSCVYVTA